MIRLQQRIFAVSSTCPVGRGAGETIRDRCNACQGVGLVVKEEELQVSISPGVDDRAVIEVILRGQLAHKSRLRRQ